MTKPDLTTEIRTAVNVLNALMKEANEMGLKVSVYVTVDTSHIEVIIH